MYQKKFIERREKQVQIINRQVIEKSSDNEAKNLAYAINSSAGYDSSHLFESKLSDERRRQLMQKRGGLETLR